jgi:hypothetical protein
VGFYWNGWLVGFFIGLEADQEISNVVLKYVDIR